MLSRQKGLEQKEKARKLRELKKYGKKVRCWLCKVLTSECNMHVTTSLLGPTRNLAEEKGREEGSY